MDERRIDLGDVEVAVLEAGVGGRPLLLVHGFTGAKEDFADHVDDLGAAGWHVVAPDLRGHGASDKPEAEAAYSLETFATDQLALVGALGWEAYALLGHSMGGMIAQFVAFRDAARIERLVLMDTCHGPVEGVDPELMELGVQLARDQGMDVIADVLCDSEGPLVTDAYRRLVAERPGYADMGDRNLRQCAAAMYAAMAQEMFNQADRLDRLASLAPPTLVMVGEQDIPFLGPSERMAAAIPNAELVVVADAGHSPQFENPVAWRAAMDAFLAVPA